MSPGYGALSRSGGLSTTSKRNIIPYWLSIIGHNSLDFEGEMFTVRASIIIHHVLSWLGTVHKIGFLSKMLAVPLGTTMY